MSGVSGRTDMLSLLKKLNPTYKEELQKPQKVKKGNSFSVFLWLLICTQKRGKFEISQKSGFKNKTERRGRE